jgi:hypothetical protein
MDFSGLVKGVQDFWDFIWPPILCLVALLAITSYVAPVLASNVLSRLLIWRPTDQRQIQLFKMSKRFGFDKLLPIICAFFLVFLLQVIRNVVVMGGQMLPPVISYDPSAILLENKDLYTVKCLWLTREEAIRQQRAIAVKSTTPQTPLDASDTGLAEARKGYLEARYGAVTFSDLSQMIDSAAVEAETQHKDAPRVSGLKHSEGKIATANMLFCALKFLFVYTLIIGLLEIRRSPIQIRVARRTAMLLAVLVLGILGSFLRDLRTTEEAEREKIFIAEEYPKIGSMDCEGIDFDRRIDLNKSYESIATQEQSLRRKWWTLRFPSTTIFTWTWKQISEQKEVPSGTGPSSG